MKMLRTVRKEKGLTMKELGKMVGVSESAISQYETGKREADFETLLKLGEVLECSVDYLLRGDETKNAPTPDEGNERTKMFTDLFVQLTNEEQKMLIAQMKGLLADQE